MDFFFFDVLILGLLAYAIYTLFSGKEDRINRIFGARDKDIYDTYDKEKFNKSTLIMCIVLFVNQALFMIISRKFKMYFYVYFILTIVALAAYIIYLKKVAKKKK